EFQSNVYTSQRLVIEVFAWSSVLVLGSSIGSVLGAYIFSPIIGSIFGKYIASLVAYILIPLGAHFKERNFVDENNIRMMMLGTSIAQGMLSGYTINSRYLEAQPLPFITPMVMSFGYAVCFTSLTVISFTLLGGTIGAAVIFNLAVALITGNLSFTYFLLTLTYGGIAAAVMQLIFKNLNEKVGIRTHRLV
ncbi:hypothetical protein Angca_000509, partial [Angiostrongylus cantonensis]